MFATRVEQKAGAGFDDRTQRVFFQQNLHVRKLPAEVKVKRIERMVVERQSNTAISQLRQDDKGVIEAVMGEAVGVVAKQHAFIVKTNHENTKERKHEKCQDEARLLSLLPFRVFAIRLWSSRRHTVALAEKGGATADHEALLFDGQLGEHRQRQDAAAGLLAGREVP